MFEFAENVRYSYISQEKRLNLLNNLLYSHISQQQIQDVVKQISKFTYFSIEKT